VNAQSEAFEEALAARQVPYVVRGAARFFERPEVRQALTLLRGSARAGEGSGEGLVADVTAVLAGMQWTPQPPSGRGNVRDRWESLKAIVSQAEETAAAHPKATLSDFVEDLSRRAAEQHAPVAEGVTLATLHAAKGLEWDAVFLCGMHEGIMPIVYADGPAAVEEERRLLYVGITRARRQLSVSWSLARSPGSRPSRGASRFLAGVTPEASKAPAAKPARRRKKGTAVCRVCGRSLGTVAERKVGRCEDCPASYDERLFERLREWRLEQAGEEKVPAYVVFTDLTLQAVAETRPTSVSALAAINGIGATKLQKYGEQVLRIIAESADQTG